MPESELFKRVCNKMNIPEDKYVTQCFITFEKTGVLDVSNYTPTVAVCEAISQVVVKSMNIIKYVAKDSLLPPKGLALIMSALKKTCITDLCLTGNNITGESIQNLAEFVEGHSFIKVLILKWNNMGLSRSWFKLFCNALSKNRSIEYLDLRSNQVTTDCAMLLAKYLISNNTLKKIDLRWNLLDSKGAESLLALMETNQKIVNILLSGNPVAPAVASNLVNCSKYKDGLEAIQSSYEAKLGVLTKHIKVMEDKRIEHVDKLCTDTKRHLEETEIKLSELTRELLVKEGIIKDLSCKLKETGIGYESERSRVQALEQIIDEKQNNYLDLIATYQSTIDRLRQELLKLENDVSDRKVELEKKYSEEKTRREEAEIKRDHVEKSLDIVREQVKRCQQQIQQLVEEKQSLEEEKNIWRYRYSNLDASFGKELESMTKAAVERQRQLEKTILDLTENQAKSMEAVSEKLEHCLGEKATVDSQLTGALATIARLQHENTDLINQLSQPSRRLAHVLEELTTEKIANEKLRLEKLEVVKKLEESRHETSRLREEMAAASEASAEDVRNQRLQAQAIKNKALILAQKLKDRDKLIETIREEERKRASGLYNAVATYMERIPNTSTNVTHGPIQTE